MRRAISFLLLVVFGLPLMPLSLSVDAERNLPACCRRDGKHGCGMKNMPGNSGSSSALKAERSMCDSFPTGRSIPAGQAFFATPPAGLITIVDSHRLDAIAQTEAQYRLSCSRARLKRGPPSLLS